MSADAPAASGTSTDAPKTTKKHSKEKEEGSRSFHHQVMDWV